MKLDDLLRGAGAEAKLLALGARRNPINYGRPPSGGWWRGLAVAGSLAVLVWAMFVGGEPEQVPVADPVQPEETVLEPVVTTLPSEIDVRPAEIPQEWEVVEGWQALPPHPLTPRQGHSAIWTGDEVIFWGGSNSSEDDSIGGAAFDPETGTWRVLTEAPLGWRVFWHSAVWTGSEMVIWGGQETLGGARAGAYDPVADEWRAIATAPITDRWYGHSGTWTGTELIVWGASHDEPTGAAYDPENDLWRVIAEAPFTSRSLHSAVWTGSELIIWGGTAYAEDGNETQYEDGAAYDPVTDTWRLISSGPLAGRRQHTAVWTGSEMLLWGGAASDSSFDALDDGAAYDPATDTWRMLPSSPIEARNLHTAVWTDRGMLIWGGVERTGGSTWEAFDTGAVFDPLTNQWSGIPASDFGGSAWLLPAVWTGSELVYWGQGEEFEAAGGEAFRFFPEAAPPSAMPNVLGLRLGEAIEVLKRSGFPASAFEFDPQESDALVVAQKPGAPEVVPAGSLVGLRTATARVLSCPGVEGSDLRASAESEDLLQMGPLTFYTMGRLDDDSLFSTPNVNGHIPATKEVIQIENGNGPMWLVIRADASTRRPSLLFGSYPGGPYLTSQGVQALQIPDCGGSGYSSFVGGYLIDHPQCIRFVVYDENFATLRSHLTGVGMGCGVSDVVVDLPNDWYRAAESLTPIVTNPTEILAVGTFPLREGTHLCAQNPDQALIDLGPKDVFIGLYLREEASEGNPWPDDWDDTVMPRSIGSTMAAECVERLEMDARWRGFDYGDDLIYVLLAFGDDVSEQEKKETWEILNSFSLDG